MRQCSRASPAAIERPIATRSALRQSGQVRVATPNETSVTSPEQHVQREPQREIRDHADHRRRDHRQRRRQIAVLPQPLHVGRAEEDPDEARHERHPGHEDRAERAGEHRGEGARLLMRGIEADEAEHQDQRPRRGFGQRQAVDHVAGRQPAVALHGLLSDVGEDSVGAAERDHRHLGEEQAHLREDLIAAQQHGEQCDRPQPKRRADEHGANGAGSVRRLLEHLLVGAWSLVRPTATPSPVR